MGAFPSRGGRPDGGHFHEIGPAIDATYMSDETTDGFTGTMVGIACVDSYRRDLVAHFEYFDLRSRCPLDADVDRVTRPVSVGNLRVTSLPRPRSCRIRSHILSRRDYFGTDS